MNQELFQKVHASIEAEPAQFNMGSWERRSACGTTRCVAGWGIHHVLRGPIYVEERGGEFSPGYYDLARSLGDSVFESDVAAKLFGMDCWVARDLFYAEQDIARQFVQLAANGYEAEALSLLEGIE